MMCASPLSFGASGFVCIKVVGISRLFICCFSLESSPNF